KEPTAHPFTMLTMPSHRQITSIRCMVMYSFAVETHTHCKGAKTVPRGPVYMHAEQQRKTGGDWCLGHGRRNASAGAERRVCDWECPQAWRRCCAKPQTFPPRCGLCFLVQYGYNPFSYDEGTAQTRDECAG